MTDAAKQRTMIIGSEGNEDYLVMATDQGFVLGIKPLLLIGMDATQFGFRLRMQKGAEAKTDIENPQGTLDKMQEVFADIPWSKRSSTRFSTVLMKDIGYGVEFMDKVKTDVGLLYTELFSEIVAKIAPVDVTDQDDVLKFLTERYDEIAEQVREAYAQHTGAGTVPAQGDGIADVIAFPVPEDTDDI